MEYYIEYEKRVSFDVWEKTSELFLNYVECLDSFLIYKINHCEELRRNFKMYRNSPNTGLKLEASF